MFVLQLTQSIGQTQPAKDDKSSDCGKPGATDKPGKADKLSKDDLKLILRTRKTIYTEFESQLLDKHSPYRYGHRPLDTGDRYALLEADQLLSNFLVKTDHSAAHILGGKQASENEPASESQLIRLAADDRGSILVARNTRLLGPLLSQLGLPSNAQSTDSYDSVWALKRNASFALRKVVSLLGLDSAPKSDRGPDSHVINQKVYSLDAYEKAISLLHNHFMRYYGFCKMFLLGSFVRKHPNNPPPTSIDFRIIVPSLQREHYAEHIQFAHECLQTPVIAIKDGQKRALPITFMLIEKEHFDSFAISDPAGLFSPGCSLLLDYGCAIPNLSVQVLNELKLACVFNNTVAVRETLTEVEVYKNQLRLRSKCNVPYYTHQLLEQIYGPISYLGATPKFSPEKMYPVNMTDALVDANMRMQDLLLGYRLSLESES